MSTPIVNMGANAQVSAGNSGQRKPQKKRGGGLQSSRRRRQPKPKPDDPNRGRVWAYPKENVFKVDRLIGMKVEVDGKGVPEIRFRIKWWGWSL